VRQPPLPLALDTAASRTHISSNIIDERGYSPAERRILIEHTE
jgi:hypothetical protein